MNCTGIDVHTRKYTTTIEGRSKKVLDQFEFDNDLQGIGRFIRRMRLRGHEPAIALFESTGNYRKVLHRELEKTAIKPILANPHVRGSARIQDIVARCKLQLKALKAIRRQTEKTNRTGCGTPAPARR